MIKMIRFTTSYFDRRHTFLPAMLCGVAAVLLAALSSCAGARRSGAGGEVTGVGGASFAEPVPYGMVLIDRGTIAMGPAADDSVAGIRKSARGVSIDSFWMDETEVTNSKYKQFVFWVRDSIIRERLADPAFGGNEAFKIEEDKEGNPIRPYLNWNKAIPWRNPNEDEQRAIESVYRTNPITGQRELDPTQMNYRYEIYNHSEAARRRNRIDPETREYNTDLPVPTDLPVISKDTAYLTEEGRIVRETVTRPLTGDYDFLNTYIVNIYPDTTTTIPWSESAGSRPTRSPTGAQTICAVLSARRESISSLTACRQRRSGNMPPAPETPRARILGRRPCLWMNADVSMRTSSRWRATSCATGMS